MARKLYIGPISDNRRWDHIHLRPSDIIVATPPKCGTTWTQTILSLLLSGDPEVDTQLAHKMPWIDIRTREIEDVAPRIEEMTHRRAFKSHTPLDGLPFHPEVQYFCVLRHPLDAHFSYRRHIANLPFKTFEAFFPEGDPDKTFKRFLDGAPEGHDMDAMPLAHIVQHFKAATVLAQKPNVTVLHYADMRADLPATFARIAAQLGVMHPPEQMDALIAAAEFDNMRAHAARFIPSGTGFFKSDEEFFHSGSVGGWQGHLSKDQVASYDRVLSALLSPKDRAWLEHGAGGGMG